MNFNFTVNEKDAQSILNSLATQPYNVVAELIGSLQQQAGAQIDAQKAAIVSQQAQQNATPSEVPAVVE